MSVDEIKVEELGAAPAYRSAVDSCYEDFWIALQYLAKLAACFDFLLNGWTTFIWRLEDLAGAVVATFAASNASGSISFWTKAATCVCGLTAQLH